MQQSYETDEFSHIIYIDEAGRGCLAGPVFVGAVMWNNVQDNEWQHIRDSKKLSRKKRNELVPYIEKTAFLSSVCSSSVQEIENINILQATFTAMHRTIDQILYKLEGKQEIDPENILLCIDGNNFKPYMYKGKFISHVCIPKGDNKYVGIAAASILAKVYHDRYILDLCKTNSMLNTQYGWEKNVCYGTKLHIEGIMNFGITKHHRKTFGICRNY